MSDFSSLFRNASEDESSAPILGHLPDWIKERNVTLVYNGPIGKWDFEKETAKTWFDGMSFLTGFYLTPGTDIARMRKRFLRSTALDKAEANGKYIITEFGTPGSSDPDKGLLQRTLSSIVPGEMTDNCACACINISGVTVATTETSLLRVLDPDTLETGERGDLSSKVNILSGRYLTDPDTGDVYNIAATFTTGLKYHFVKFPAASICPPSSPPQAALTSSMQLLASFGSRMKTCFAYYHTFAMTENYLVFIEKPWVANSLKLLSSKIKGQSLRDCLEWHPDERNLFHLVNKKSGEVQKVKYLSDKPFFFLNHVNAFEVGEGNIIVDIIGYDNPDMLDDLTLTKLRSGEPNMADKAKQGRIMRFALPVMESEAFKSMEKGSNLLKDSTVYGTATAKVSPTLDSRIEIGAWEVISEIGCEHPMVNPKVVGKRYNYSYVIGWMCNKGFFANSITKVNMTTGDNVAWRGGEFLHPAEPVFIPAPGKTRK